MKLTPAEIRKLPKGVIRAIMLEQLIVNGLIAGSIYALIALGFSLIYGVCRFFHFAHGAVITCAGYLAFAFSQHLGVPLGISIAISILLCALIGMLMEWGVYRPLRAKHASNLMLLVASLGIYIVIQNTVSLIFGNDVHVLTAASQSLKIPLFEARITIIQVIILAVTGFLYWSTGLFMRRSQTGKVMRAVASDPDLAPAVGIDANLTILMVFALGSGLAAVTGICISFNTVLTPTMGFNALLMGVVAAIIGGIGSLPGALLGGLFVGLVQPFTVWKLPSQWQDTIVFALLIFFLLLRPQGILGRPLKSAAV